MTTHNVDSSPLIAAILPCYRVTGQVLDVIAAMPELCQLIICVDDCCPDGSGDHIEQHCTDPRVVVLRHDANQGVGGALITGYRAAMDRGANICVKVDGDGQMDPALLPDFVAPILAGHADYTKGNRFHSTTGLSQMPAVRLLGNAALSFMTKLSTGYWTLFDPANGYTAIETRVLAQLPLEKVAKGYFFETDMLFRLSTVRARVMDIPMLARYADEVSSLRISRILGPFLLGHGRNMFKRFAYNYLLRDFNLASLLTITGISFGLFGAIFGAFKWMESVETGIPASTGTVMIAILPVILGVQFLLSAAAYDIASVPKRAIHPLLPEVKRKQDHSNSSKSGGES